LKNGWAKLAGPTETMKREEQEHIDAHRAQQRCEEDKLITSEQARRAKLRDDAEAKLREAKEEHVRVTREWEIVRKRILDTKIKVSDHESDLAQATANLRRLGRQNVELVISSLRLFWLI
jgi:hypothetical protein